jgi:hypothetical protein
MSESLEYIERYFEEKMNPDEKKEFEDRCIQDPAFAREVAVYAMMQDQMARQWKEEKKQEFNSLAAESSGSRIVAMPGTKPNQGKLRTLNSWKYAAIAASVVLVIAVGVVFYFQYAKQDSSELAKNENKNQQQQIIDTARSPKENIDSNKPADNPKEVPLPETDIAKYDQLVAMNFKPDKIPANTEGLLADAFDEYKKGNYKEAIRSYKETEGMLEVETRGEDEQEEKERKQILFYARYYSAISHMANGNPLRAIAEFKSAGLGPDKYWQNKIRWYSALAYLKTGKITIAKSLLEQVVADTHSRDYKKKAAALLNDISTNKKDN